MGNKEIRNKDYRMWGRVRSGQQVDEVILDPGDPFKPRLMAHHLQPDAFNDKLFEGNLGPAFCVQDNKVMIYDPTGAKAAIVRLITVSEVILERPEDEE